MYTEVLPGDQSLALLISSETEPMSGICEYKTNEK